MDAEKVLLFGSKTSIHWMVSSGLFLLDSLYWTASTVKGVQA